MRSGLCPWTRISKHVSHSDLRALRSESLVGGEALRLLTWYSYHLATNWWVPLSLHTHDQDYTFLGSLSWSSKKILVSLSDDKLQSNHTSCWVDFSLFGNQLSHPMNHLRKEDKPWGLLPYPGSAPQHPSPPTLPVECWSSGSLEQTLGFSTNCKKLYLLSSKANCNSFGLGSCPLQSP